MPYLRKVKIKGNEYFYLFHTVRDGNKFRKLSRYIGKEKPSEEELEILKKDLIKKTEVSIETKEEKKPRKNILGILREIQEKHGYLPEDKIRKLSKKLNMPVIDIYSAATFYSMLSVKKKGKNIVRICNSPSCYLNGSLNILEEAKKLLKIDINETTKDGKFTLELTSCIGCCDKAPAIMVNNELIGNITKEKLRRLLR